MSQLGALLECCSMEMVAVVPPHAFLPLAPPCVCSVYKFQPDFAMQQLLLKIRRIIKAFFFFSQSRCDLLPLLLSPPLLLIRSASQNGSRSANNSGSDSRFTQFHCLRHCTRHSVYYRSLHIRCRLCIRMLRFQLWKMRGTHRCSRTRWRLRFR